MVSHLKTRPFSPSTRSNGFIPHSQRRGVQAAFARRARTRAARFAATLLAAFALLAVAAAQYNTAGLGGVVLDPSGRAVVGANLVLASAATGAQRASVSNSDGSYAFEGVLPGDYTLTVIARGFARWTRAVPLHVNERAVVKVSLGIEQAPQSVTVVATPPVDTQQTETSTVINSRLVQDLPTHDGSTTDYALTNSAATRPDAPILAPAPTSGLDYNGMRPRANSCTQDGTDANDDSVNGCRTTLPQNAVQEFDILQNGYQAEYGGVSGSVINIVSRQGANATHAEAFGYLRNRKFEAVNAFANQANPEDTFFRGGYDLGGALQKDKTFYFVSFEMLNGHSVGYSQIGANNYGLIPVSNPFGTIVASGLPYFAEPNAVAMMTPEQVVYLKTQAASGAAGAQQAALYYLLTGAAANLGLTGNAAGNGFLAAPGWNSRFLLSAAPLPASYTPLESLAGNYPSTSRTAFGSMRLDREFSSRQSAFLSFSYSPSFVTGVPSNGENQLTALNAFSRTTSTRTDDYDLSGQWLASGGAGWTNEVHGQVSRRGLNLLQQNSGVAVELPAIASFGAEPFAPELRTERHIEASDTFSRIFGAHILKFGVDTDFIPVSAIFPLNQNGIYFFAADQPANDPIFGPLASFWGAGAPPFNAAQAYGWGTPSSFVQQFGGFSRAQDSFTDKMVGSFIQDTVHVSSRLTLDLGLRHDLNLTPQFGAANSEAAFAQNFFNVGRGIPRRKDDFSPRLGLAFDPSGDGRQVIRAHYGIFYGHPLLGIAFLSDVVDGVQSPFLIVPHDVGADDCFQGASFTPFGVICSPALGYEPSQQRFNVNSPAFQTPFSLGVSPVPPQILPVANNFRNDYTEQSGLTYARQVGANSSLTLQFNSIHGVHLLRARNINQGNRNLLRAYDAALAGQGPLTPLVGILGAAAPLGQLIFNGFRPSGPNYAWAQSALGIQPASLRALASGFGLPTGPAGGLVPYFDVKEYESSGSSTYNGLSVDFQHRYSSRFQGDISYTWSHAIDDSTDLQTLQEPQDDSLPGLERANSTFDQRHRMVISGLYDLPGAAANGFAGAIFGNWQAAPIIELSSGRPYNIITNFDRTGVNNDSDARPSVVPLGTPGSFPSPDGKVGLALPPQWQIGTLGRNVYTTPAFYNTDLRMTRHFPLSEHVGMDFMTDMFNLFNHVNVREVDTAFNDAGRAVAAFNPRQFQFGLRLTY
jgi:hypothetical protein